MKNAVLIRDCPKPSWGTEEECSADQSLYEANLGYKEGRDALNQVRRGGGVWPEIAMPAPGAVQRRWLCGAVLTHFVGERESTEEAGQRRQRWKE